jgi:ribulose-5-phosphate 4-epimerase/fuculose-1-phosphate aldolase
MNARIDTDTSNVKSLVSEQEWQLRVDLAACYRMIAMHRWDDLIFTHISARIPGPEHHFLINPYGLMFEEITASSLVKVDQECKPVLPTKYPVNPAGFVIHHAIHSAREDVVCVLHTHTAAGVAVSAQEAGLLPISQQASVVLTSLAYHDYEGIAVLDDEKPRLQADLGKKTNLMLRNHGLLTVGPTIADAFIAMYTFERACQIQIAAQGNGAVLRQVTPKVLDGVKQAVMVVTKGMGGSLAWPALLRKLDRTNPGYAE